MNWGRTMNTNPNTQLNINEEALQKAIKWALSHDKQLLVKQAKDEHLTAIYRYYSTNTPNPSNHQITPLWTTPQA